jgi:GT2 family glycosyltransferase
MNTPPPTTFSIVIETDNLALVDLDELRACLATLDRQGAVLHQADGIFVADGGTVPTALLQELTSRYPWLTILRADAGASYVALKMAGTLETHSDLIIFCDGDVQYEPGWLAALLQGFAERPDADVIAGETTTPVSGPYTLAFALSFNFPRFSGESRLAASPTYWANNVAAKRTTLERIPLPDEPNVFRGQNLLHASRVLAHSGVILRQPLARAWHAVLPPSEIVGRYFALGRDAARLRTITTNESGRPHLGAMAPDRSGTGVMGRLIDRLGQLVRSQPSALVWLPLALPALAIMGAAYLAGRATANQRLRRHEQCR